MQASELTGLDAHPQSVAEWEDLLVKMEIMPRVLRNTLEGVSPDEAGVARELEELVRRERHLMEWLQGVARVRSDADAPRPAAGGDPRDLPLVFASLRARSFAMVQRRGLEVWEWTGPLEGGARASVYQALCWLVREDVRTLAALRQRAGAPAC